MKHGKKIIFYCIIFMFVFVVIFTALRCRNASGSLEKAFMDLRLAEESIKRIERQFDEAGRTIKELRGELDKERENYNKLEQYGRELEAEHIRQREIYTEFGITIRSNQEAVNQIAGLVGQSRDIIEGLLEECQNAEN